MLQSLSAPGLNASSSTNREMHDFVTKLALLSKSEGSVSYTICPYPSRVITGSASKAQRCRILQNQHFQKKGVGKFSKKTFLESPMRQLLGGMLRLFEPSDPFQRTVYPRPPGLLGHQARTKGLLGVGFKVPTPPPYQKLKSLRNLAHYFLGSGHILLHKILCAQNINIEFGSGLNWLFIGEIPQ